MREILRINTDEKSDERLKDFNNRGLVYNTLKHKLGFTNRVNMQKQVST
jgi:hypothetical protein